MPNPRQVYKKMIDLVIKLAEHGLVHGDFNEFNLMIDDDEVLTMIDFPQMVSTSHVNAQYYFNRDVKNVQIYFERHYGLEFDGVPTIVLDIDKDMDLDHEVKASGFLKSELGKDYNKVNQAFDQVADGYLEGVKKDEENDDENDGENSQNDENENEDQENDKEQEEKKQNENDNQDDDDDEDVEQN